MVQVFVEKKTAEQYAVIFKKNFNLDFNLCFGVYGNLMFGSLFIYFLKGFNITPKQLILFYLKPYLSKTKIKVEH